MTGLDFAATVRRRLVETRQSKHRAAVDRGLPQDAIRSVLKGHRPRLDRVEEICDALGLELYIGPWRDTGPESPEIPIQPEDEAKFRFLARFNSQLELPIRSWKNCSPEGYLTGPDDSGRAPAPEDLPDPQAFYSLAPGHSMLPAGIWAGDHCLISRHDRLEVGRRVWLRHENGPEAIRLLIGLTATTYELLAWRPPDETGCQDMVAEQWKLEDVADRGVLLAVYRGRPSAEHPPFRLPDWQPDPVAALWWSVAAEETGADSETDLSRRVEELMRALEQKVSAFDEKIRGWLDQGTVSKYEVLGVLQEVEKVKQSVYLLSSATRKSEK